MKSAVASISIILLFAGALAAAEQKAAMGGLEISVADANGEIDGYSSYTVTLKNTTSIAKTLSGAITIQGAAGEACTVYGEAPAGQTRSFQMHCRGRGVWTFAPIRVFD
ncbi:MAG: hypothetical protein HY042_09725, partial [Spirochaetia bacterium]|nr:hypothetical protein [Spirochaetia bacterium]